MLPRSGPRDPWGGEDYLLPTMVFRSMRSADRLGLDVPTTADEYLSDRVKPLRKTLEDTNRLAGADELPDARTNDKGLKLSPLEDDTPPEAKLLKSQTYGLLPHVISAMEPSYSVALSELSQFGVWRSLGGCGLL